MLTRQVLRYVLFVFFCATNAPSFASHLAGGQMSYQYLGDTMIAGQVNHKYLATLVLYQDCSNGQPEAMLQDNPAFFSVFDGNWSYVYVDTAIYYSSVMEVFPAISPCGPTALPPFCMRKVVFKRTYILPASPAGHVIAYQRCCRNAQISNLQNPKDRGLTYFCTIPGTVNNSCAQFVNDMPQIMCLEKTFVFDHSATDADRDSLTYSFCEAIIGASDADIKPIPKPGPYQPMAYVDPYTPTSPMPSDPAIKLDMNTGMLYCTATKVGLYQLAVCVSEWRGGVLINKTSREFQVLVSDCSGNAVGGVVVYKPYAGGDKSILAGDHVQFNAYGGNDYEWTPATFLSDPHIANPEATFPGPGDYMYVLRTVSDSGCVGKDTVTIHVLEHSEFAVPNAFSPNGDHLNDVLKPIPVVGAQLKLFRVFNRKGQMVHEGGLTDKGWDGTFHGVLQDVGTYYWELYYYDNKGVLRLTKGDVTLVQ
jgi:gliding motility-associated-like protein